MANIIDDHDLSRISDYEASTQYFLRKWGVRKLESNNEYLKTYLKSFSIGNIMQVRPQDMELVGINSKDINSELFADNFLEEKYQG